MKRRYYVGITIFIFLCSLFSTYAQSLDKNLSDAVRKKEYKKVEKEITKSKFNIKGDKGTALLVLACKYGDEKMVNLILNAGADINGADDIGRTAMLTAYAYEQDAILELLKSQGANDEAPITRRDYDCMAHDKLTVGMKYNEVEKLVGDLGKSTIDAMKEREFEIEISHLEKYRFKNAKLSYWRHPCKTSKEQMTK